METESLIDTLEACEANNLLLNNSMTDNSAMMDIGRENMDLAGAFDQCAMSTGMVNGHVAMDESVNEENTANVCALSSSEDVPVWKQWLYLDTLQWPGLFDNRSTQDQFISDGVLFDNSGVQDQTISDEV